LALASFHTKPVKVMSWNWRKVCALTPPAVTFIDAPLPPPVATQPAGRSVRTT
jgi:hypothetical protein